MKREAPFVVAGSVLTAGLVLHASLAEWGQVLPGGPRAWGQAWGAWRLGGGGAEVAGEVVLAGWPVLATITGLDLLFPLAIATTLAVWIWLAAGLVSGWFAARSLGAERLAAAAAALACGANPALLQGLAEGRYEWLAAPWFALGLVAAHRDRAAWVGLACLGAALHTPLLGAALAGLCALAATSSWRASAASLGAGAAGVLAVSWPWWGLGELPGGETAVLASGNPGDWLEPFFAWRDQAVAPGLALWVGAPLGVWAWRRGVLSAGMAAGALAALVLSVGPALRWGAVTFSLQGTVLPAPAAVLEALVPLDVVTWKSVLVAGFVALGLGLARLPRGPALAWLAVGLFGVAWTPVGAVDGRTPIALEQLPEGPILNLPMDVRHDGSGQKWLYHQTVHGRPLSTGMGPVEPHVFLADPLVVLAVNAAWEDDRYAIPDQTATVVLQGQGVRTLVFDRTSAPLSARVLMDELLTRYVGAPQRDLAGGIDLYAVEQGAGAVAEPALLRERRTPEVGYLTQTAWLEEHPPGR